MHLTLPSLVFISTVLSFAQDVEKIPDCAEDCMNAVLEAFECGTFNETDYECACGYAFGLLDLGYFCLTESCSTENVTKTLDVAGKKCEQAGYPIQLPPPLEEPPEEEPPVESSVPHPSRNKRELSVANLDTQVPGCAYPCLGDSIVLTKCSTPHRIPYNDFDLECACNKGNEILQSAQLCIQASCDEEEGAKIFEESGKTCHEHGFTIPSLSSVTGEHTLDQAGEENNILVRRGSAFLHEEDDASSWPAPPYVPPAPTSAKPQDIVAPSSAIDSCVYITTTTTLTISITSKVAPYPTSSDLVPLPTSTGAVTGTAAPATTTTLPPMFTGAAFGSNVPIIAAGLVAAIAGLL